MDFLQEYTMLDELGKGGFATVYKVRHNELGYIRAIRVLNETIVDVNCKTYQDFLCECRDLLRFGDGKHPNIVHVYQPRLLNNIPLVEMEYVEGQTILQYLEQESYFITADEVICLAIQISSALAYCHEDIWRFYMDKTLDGLQESPNGCSKIVIDDETRQRLINKYKVIHNKIHSGNIIHREDGTFVLMDFGFTTRFLVEIYSEIPLGALEFVAPENGDSLPTEQSDIYSFGVVLYQCLAGRVPFPYDVNSRSYKAAYALKEAHQKATPPSIEGLRKEFFEKKYQEQKYEKDYPQWLEDVILKCLQKNPVDRFRNGRELYNYIVEHINNTDVINEKSELDFETLMNQFKELETEVENLREVNKSLNMVINEKQNTIMKIGQELKEAQGQIEELKDPKERFTTEKVIKKGTSIDWNELIAHK